MREAVIQLSSTLLAGIVSDEACAAELERIAADLDGRVEAHLVLLLRMISRHHTVKAMELRGRLAALTERYDAIMRTDG